MVSIRARLSRATDAETDRPCRSFGLTGIANEIAVWGKRKRRGVDKNGFKHRKFYRLGEVPRVSRGR